MDGTSTNVIGSTIAKPQKAFAIAFAVLATALAGCASGLGATATEHSAITSVSRLEEGTVVGATAAAEASHAYMVRLGSGELISVKQSGKHVIAPGTLVVIQFGDNARVIPQNSSIGSI